MPSNTQALEPRTWKLSRDKKGAPYNPIYVLPASADFSKLAAMLQEFDRIREATKKSTVILPPMLTLSLNDFACREGLPNQLP